VSRNPRRAYRAALAASAAALAGLAFSIAVPAVPALAADNATINGGQTHQTIAGFGASEGFGEAATVMNASSSVQQ
jgi:O-glycosyl hydrolase